MGKTHRGSLLRKEIPRSGRGYCKVTKRSGVKLLYDYKVGGVQTKISKLGRAILENRRKREEKAQKAASSRMEGVKKPNDAKSTDAKSTDAKSQDVKKNKESEEPTAAPAAKESPADNDSDTVKEEPTPSGDNDTVAKGESAR